MPDVPKPQPLAPTTDAPRPATRVGSSTLLLHAVQVGLARMIPVPFVDDAVGGYVERRLVAQIARAHGLVLPPEALRQIANGPGGGTLGKIATGVLTLPFKLIFRTVFFVLELKGVADTMSAVYHRGYLLDLALGAGALAPQGPRSPAELRRALDTALTNTAASPVTAAVRGVLEGSRDLLARAGSELYARLQGAAGRGPVSDEVVAAAVEPQVQDGTTPSEAPAVGGLVERLKRALDQVPRGHFVELEQRLETALGVPLVR